MSEKSRPLSKELSPDDFSQATDTVLKDSKGAGVHNIEIYAQQYQHIGYRIALFFSIFLVAYAYGLDGSVRYTLQSYATSSYSQHSLLAAVNCIKAVIAAGGQICFARASDIFGRVTILIVSIVFYAMGTIIECQATNVSRFAAGACFYQLGYTGIILILEIIAMDFSNLNWRLLASFVPALPFIINTWISGDVVQAIGMNWKWGIGMWAFIFPLSCIPLLGCLLHMRYLAHKNAPQDLKPELQIVKQMSWSKYLIEIFVHKLDILGLILLCVAFGCILVPFTLAGGLKSKWKTASIIVPEVIGWCVAAPLYLVWEYKFARHPVTPWSVIKDRGIYAAIIIAFHINFCWYMQGDYMYTVLVVAVDESAKSATRITSLYSFVSVITGTILGFVVVKVRRTKRFILFGIGCWFIAFGLLVHFRGGPVSHSGVIGSLCLLGFGAGFFTYTTQASIQASTTSHSNMAVITALYLAVYNIGSAVGAAVSGAVWMNVLPQELAKNLKNSELVSQAYSEPFTFILKYTWMTVERQAVMRAYRYVQKILCIVGLCFCVPLLTAAFLLRDRKLENVVALEDLEKRDKKEADSSQESSL
ncbi:LAMI_0F13410g1_1 [Lachancea mirantina]|uniref:LAMI_0F13410g1_1 n=1 Tax=Lachancea mirantina TaxID=1230905 RepID=A0A1G4K3A1_9SACH|nr:LAMI_0F13410g1_1 [Lachancea mirantina]